MTIHWQSRQYLWGNKHFMVNGRCLLSKNSQILAVRFVWSIYPFLLLWSEEFIDFYCLKLATKCMQKWPLHSSSMNPKIVSTYLRMNWTHLYSYSQSTERTRKQLLKRMQFKRWVWGQKRQLWKQELVCGSKHMLFIQTHLRLLCYLRRCYLIWDSTNIFFFL